MCEKIYNKLSSVKKINSDSYLKELKENSGMKDKEVEILYKGVATKLINSNVLEEIELNENCWLFNLSWHHMQFTDIKTVLAENMRFSDNDMELIVETCLELTDADNKDYIDRYLDIGNYYHFNDGRYFVDYRKADQLKICASCGLAEELDTDVSSHTKEIWYS